MRAVAVVPAVLGVPDVLGVPVVLAVVCRVPGAPARRVRLRRGCAGDGHHGEEADHPDDESMAGGTAVGH
jgi:hypothetical protein